MAEGCTQRQVAEVLGVSPRHVRRLIEDGVLPRPKAPRRYDLAACVEAYYRWKFDRGTDSEAPDLSRERALLARSQRQKVELELRVRRQELVELSRVEAVLSEVFSRCRSKLLALPTKAAPLLVGVKSLPRARDLLDGLVREVLSELAALEVADLTEGNGEADGDAETGVADVGTPAEAHGKRVGRRAKGAQPRGKRRAGAVVH